MEASWRRLEKILDSSWRLLASLGRALGKIVDRFCGGLLVLKREQEKNCSSLGSGSWTDEKNALLVLWTLVDITAL